MTLIRGVLGLVRLVGACNKPTREVHTAATATVPESESNLSIEKVDELIDEARRGGGQH